MKWNVQIVVHTYILSQLPAPKLTVKINSSCVYMHNLLCMYVYIGVDAHESSAPRHQKRVLGPLAGVTGG